MGAGSFLPVHGTRLAAVRHAFDISRSTEPPALRRPSTGYSNSGSLAVLAATRRASSRVMSFAAASPRLVLEIDVGERVPVGVADDEAILAELDVRVVDRGCV